MRQWDGAATLRHGDMGTWRHCATLVTRLPVPPPCLYRAGCRVQDCPLYNTDVNILGQDILSNSTTIFCLCIISIIRLQVSTWTTVVLQYNVSGWPGCCMSRLWYAILHCASCSRADCGVWRHKNVPIQLSSQRSESGPGYYTCFYPVNMNIVTAFLSEMHGNMTCIKANFIGWNIMLNVIFILWWW